MKRGGGIQRIPFDELTFPARLPPDEVLQVDEALARLASIHPERAELVRLRYFAGMTLEEAAQAMGISRSQAERSWAYSRAWLLREISGNAMPGIGFRA